MNHLVMIGASTGGPVALRELLDGMPRLDAAVLIVLHMPKYINASICKSLAALTDLDVSLAEDGTVLERGRLLIAPSERHLVVENNHAVRLVAGPPRHNVCPAVDEMMGSVSRSRRLSFTGVVLTGMGNDGAEGISHVRGLGGLTMAQDEASCAVFGMPQRAIETGDVEFVGNPKQIAARLVREVGTIAGAPRPVAGALAAS